MVDFHASGLLSEQIADGIALVALHNPPVNVFGHALRRALYDRLCALPQMPRLHAIVLLGSGRGFSARALYDDLEGNVSRTAP